MPIPCWRSSSARSPMIQTPGCFISTMAETRSAVPSQSNGTSSRRHRIAVERDNPERMSGEREAAYLARAGIEHVEQHALTVLDVYRFAVTEHPAIDREQAVADLEALGFFLGRPVGRGAHFLQGLDRRARQRVHRHVAAATEGRAQTPSAPERSRGHRRRDCFAARCRPARPDRYRCRGSDRYPPRHAYDRNGSPRVLA